MVLASWDALLNVHVQHVLDSSAIITNASPSIGLGGAVFGLSHASRHMPPTWSPCSILSILLNAVCSALLAHLACCQLTLPV